MCSATYNPLSNFTIIIRLLIVSTHCVINYFRQWNKGILGVIRITHGDLRKQTVDAAAVVEQTTCKNFAKSPLSSSDAKLETKEIGRRADETSLPDLPSSFPFVG
jgi:hypothetical protein